MKYILLKSKSPFELENVVNIHLENGLSVQGEVSYSAANDRYTEDLYMQAMIKGGLI